MVLLPGHALKCLLEEGFKFLFVGGMFCVWIALLSLKLCVKFVLFSSTGVTHSCVVEFQKKAEEWAV